MSAFGALTVLVVMFTEARLCSADVLSRGAHPRFHSLLAWALVHMCARCAHALEALAPGHFRAHTSFHLCLLGVTPPFVVLARTDAHTHKAVALLKMVVLESQRAQLAGPDSG